MSEQQTAVEQHVDTPEEANGIAPEQTDVDATPSSDPATAEDTATADDDTATDEPPATASPAPKKRARKQSTARKTRTVELTLTVTGTAEGDWQAELTHSGKRVVQGLSIPASAVSNAAAELHQDISEAIDSVLSEARRQHEEKLAELQAEVERVQKALADLES